MKSTSMISAPKQELRQFMTDNANMLFSLGWLRKQLWTRFQQSVAAISASEMADYASIFNQSDESVFTWLFLIHHRTTLDNVRAMAIDNFDGENTRQTLFNRRLELIDELSRIHFSSLWTNITSAKPRSWNTIARRMRIKELYDKNPSVLDEFFVIIDELSIITDILFMRQAKNYGIDIDIDEYQRPILPMTTDLLINALNDCAPYFKNDGSKWAAVYYLMKEDYHDFIINGTNILKSKRQFENFIVDYMNKPSGIARLGPLPNCYEGAISKATSNNCINKDDTYMDKRISQWPEGEMKLMATELRKAIARQRGCEEDGNDG